MLNRKILLAGNLVGSIYLMHAGSLQFTTNTKGTTTTVVINYNENDGSVKKEEVVLNKIGKEWSLVRKDLQKEVHFRLHSPQAAKFFVDDLEFELHPNLDMYVRGTYDGNLCIDHANKVVTGAKWGPLTVHGNFFINKATMLENRNILSVEENFLCLLTAIQNKGTIVVGQGWQVMALQKFTNEASGNFAMQRADIVSPATEVNNRGNIACVLDWKGEPCTFNNIAGGQVQIGGNCTLKALNNKSEFEPQIAQEFKEVKREFFDAKGNLLIQIPAVLKGYSGKFRDNSQSSNAWIGCKRMLHFQQSFKDINREGKRSAFYVNHDCILIEQSSLRHSDIFIGGKIEIKSTLTIYSTQSFQKTIESAFYHQDIRGCRHGLRGHPHYHDYWFADIKTNMSPFEFIIAHLEVFGVITGKIETFINGKAGTTQPVVIKATEAKYEQHKNALERLAGERGIPLMLLVDEAEYEENLQAMKENPVFQTMVRQQELRQARSAAPSGAPSRSLTPEQ